MASQSTKRITLPEAIATNPGRPESQFEIQETLTSSQSNDITERVQDENEPIDYPTGIKLYAIILSLILISLTSGLDVSIVAIAVPALSNQFHSINDIGWYATALRLVMCSFLFLAGKAYTLFKIKTLIMSSVVVCCIGLCISTFAQTSAIFIAGRAISGLGGAGVMSGYFAIFTASFPLSKRPLIGGLLGGIETIASMSAPLIGGALVDGWTWRACFGITLPLYAVILVIMWIYLDVPDLPDVALPLKERIKKLDLLGLAVFVPSITCLLIALQWGGTTYGWNDPKIISLFVTFAVLLAAFGYIQHHFQEHATLPIRILKNRNLLAGAWFCSCANGTLAVVEYYMSIYFQGPRGKSAAQAGVFALPMVIGLCVSCVIAGAGTSWLGYYVPFMYVTSLFGPIATGLLTTIDLQTGIVKLVALLALTGFACGSGIMAPQVAAQTVLPAKEVTIGYAMIQFGSQMGPVLFTSASATLFINRLRAEIQQYSPTTNITSIEHMGLADIRKNIGGKRLSEVLLGYDEAVVQTLYLPVALTCLTIVGCLAMDWRNVKKKPE